MSASKDPIRDIVGKYGDLLFDLSESILWSSANAQIAFRAILKEIRRSVPAQPYVENERAWILRVACKKLLGFASRNASRTNASEQIQLDSSENISARLKQFDSFFHRLPFQDQMLLLLRDKYGVEYQEIASALAIPEASLKIQRQNALRALEEWVWDGG